MNTQAKMVVSVLQQWGEKDNNKLMYKVRWSLNDTTVHLTKSLPSIKNETMVVYDTPEYNKLRYK